MKDNNIEQIIRKKLRQTMDCHFKRAWIPKGWTCIKTNQFTKELARELRKNL